MCKKILLAVMLTLGLCLVLATVAAAQDTDVQTDKGAFITPMWAPNTIMYQGRLTNAAGAPLTDTVTVTFGIYAAPSGGTALWQGAYLSRPDANGIISQELGTIPDTVFTGSQRYLQITVRTDPPMTPRQTLTAAPYAMRTAMSLTRIQPGTGFQFVTFKSTSSTPIAFGFVSAAGDRVSGTSNFTSAWNATSGWYEITITAESYFFNTYTTVVTTAGANICFANTDSSGGKLLVYFFRI